MSALPLAPLALRRAGPVCCAPEAPPLPDEVLAAYAAQFGALADPTRVGIVNALARAGEACVCVLTDQAGLSQPTVSHHLKVLRDAGLVESERRGRWAFYRLVPGAVERLSRALAA